jgi:hypothetical protein
MGARRNRAINILVSEKRGISLRRETISASTYLHGVCCVINELQITNT